MQPQTPTIPLLQCLPPCLLLPTNLFHLPLLWHLQALLMFQPGAESMAPACSSSSSSSGWALSYTVITSPKLGWDCVLFPRLEQEQNLPA